MFTVTIGVEDGRNTDVLRTVVLEAANWNPGDSGIENSKLETEDLRVRDFEKTAIWNTEDLEDWRTWKCRRPKGEAGQQQHIKKPTGK